MSSQGGVRLGFYSCFGMRLEEVEFSFAHQKKVSNDKGLLYRVFLNNFRNYSKELFIFLNKARKKMRNLTLKK